MPKEPFRAARLTDVERRLALGFCRDTDHVASIRRYARYFAAFLDLNPEMRAAGTTTAIAHFVVQFLVAGRSPHTVEGMIKGLYKYGVTVETPNGSESLYRRENIRGQAAALCKSTDPRRTKTHVGVDEFLSLVRRKPASGKLVDLYAIFYVVIATGNRPSSVLWAKEITLDEDAIYVRWGRRKIRKAMRKRERYPFDWSAEPPTWIQERLTDWDGWIYPAKTRISATLNAWLRRSGIPWSSTAPRDAMSELLRKEVESFRMTEAMFSRLLDHNADTSARSYGLNEGA